MTSWEICFTPKLYWIYTLGLSIQTFYKLTLFTDTVSVFAGTILNWFMVVYEPQNTKEEFKPI